MDSTMVSAPRRRRRGRRGPAPAERALAGAWHYDVPRGGGRAERDAPAKNERLFD